MLTLEFFTRLFQLDLQWFVELAMHNLLWVFALVAVTFVYNNLKFSWKIFIVIVIMIFSTVEAFESVNIVILVGGFLFVYYIGEVILLTFTETIPSLKGKLPFTLTIYFFIMVALYALGVF
ncbi:hypothetical protein KKG83_06865 [Candidatus Micrarchaeota archaeon]|nr:hypothetical protein [Candidatus Micrarchaeota archaeon]MBU2477165.1 hypothetical protein [Candidatus Micrarchaeota archaeon]